ncbi:MAG: cytochrome c biogenesis protein, partial [Aquificae bacterium]|nr:cytochrome c biogenesis protein [Aquificota bacterium]
MRKLAEFLSGFGGLTLSFILFTAVVVVGLFHLEYRPPLYWALLAISGGTFLVSFLLNLVGWIRAIAEDYRRTGNPLNFLYEFFASLKLAIFIMLVLGILSMLGSTYIQQNRPFEWYLDQFGYEVGIWIWKLYLNDVFHSWYYVLFIVLLAINLIVCSIKRLPAVWRQAFGKERFTRLDEKMEKRLKAITVRIPGSEDLIRFLKRKGFKVYMEEEGGRTYLYAEKGRFSRLGVYITHIALLVIMAGALIDALVGIRGSLLVAEGDTSDTILVGPEQKRYKLPFAVRLVDFRIKTYGEENPNVDERIAMAVSSYESDIEILERGEVVARGTVKVNEPFDYGRYRLFQATYGILEGTSGMGVIVVDRKKARENPEEAVVGTFTIRTGKVVEFRDMLISIERVILNIHDPDNQNELAPAVVLKVLLNRKAYNVPVIYDPRLTAMVFNQIEDLRDFPYMFFMDGFEPLFFSGLEVSYHPGTPLIWIGSTLLVLGMAVAFYTVHRKVWVRIEGKEAKIALYSHKFKEEFKRTFLRELEALHSHAAKS